MNRLTIIGNLTRDPELRSVQTANGAANVCDFTVAVNRRRKGQNGQDEADFFRVTAWNQLGENASKYLAKGRKVAVVGAVSVRTYQASDGSTRASLEVQANDIEFLTPRNEAGSVSDGASGGYAAPAPAAPAPAPAPATQAHQMGFTEVEMGDDELPF